MTIEQLLNLVSSADARGPERRERIATAAFVALITGRAMRADSWNIDALAPAALELADKLIAELDKPRDKP